MEETYEEKYAEGEIDLPDDLYAVSAIGSDYLWAAGYFGAIYRTTDGGKNWRKLNGLTDQSIYDISFADEKNGWAVGRQRIRDPHDRWRRHLGAADHPAQAARSTCSRSRRSTRTRPGRSVTGADATTPTTPERPGRTVRSCSRKDHPSFKYL